MSAVARFALLCAVLVPLAVRGDAIIRTQAMFASTIAEFYIEDTEVRLELEIGLADLGAFRDLLPDEIRARLGFDPEPLQDRVRRFMAEQLVIIADGQPLPGALTAISPAHRIRRDEITGEALPATAEPETVVNAQFRWPLARRPGTLEFRPQLPATASIGFVAYHKGIAVNDFRYLTPSQTLTLDWNDPWYSEFGMRALRRQYYSPMAGFIYVEPYEVRKEIIVRPKDLQRYVDLGLEGRDTIPVAMQPEIREKVIAFLSQRQPVTIDGSAATAAAVRADFLERSLRTSRVIDPPEELDLNAAIMGVKFIYPHPDFADSATMRWDMFDERIRIVPVSAVDPTGPFPQFLEPDYDLLEWQNFIRVPVMPQLAEVAAPPTALAEALRKARWLLVLVALALTARAVLANRRGSGASAAAVAVIAIAVSATAWWLGSRARLDRAATDTVVAGLLTNIYRAFDFRAESDIYDVLARSVDGELLREVYLEMRRGLVLASQGGASARVKDIELIELEPRPGPDRTIDAEATWQVRAAVGHWGHIHERRNEYRARLKLRPMDGAWKLVDVEILDELRL